jgi:hypothetical protein
MIWFMVWQVISTVVELVRLGRKSESEKDLETGLLRRQLTIYGRQKNRSPRLTRGEGLTSVGLATKLKAQTGRRIKAMSEVIRIVKPTALFDWHNQLVRLKWTYRQRDPGRRPQTDREIERLAVRLTRENDGGFEVLRANCSHWPRWPQYALILSFVSSVPAFDNGANLPRSPCVLALASCSTSPGRSLPNASCLTLILKNRSICRSLLLDENYCIYGILLPIAYRLTTTLQSITSPFLPLPLRQSARPGYPFPGTDTRSCDSLRQESIPRYHRSALLRAIGGH